MPAAPVFISAAVEGTVDEAVVRCLLAHVGLMPGEIYGRNGKSHIRKRIRGYNNAAQYSPWIVLVDLDLDSECAPSLRQSWLPNSAPHMCFRIAVREVEAWLLADCERVASFLSVPLSRVPIDPEALGDPKAEIVALAHSSRQRYIRKDMVPRPGSGRVVGPAYNSRLVEFINNPNAPWRPDVASKRSDSLRRSIECLRRLIQGQQSSERN